MTDDRVEPTSPEASAEPLEEPVDSRPSLDEEWARKFAGTVAESFEKSIDEALDRKLKPVTEHIEREEVETGKLLRVLAEMSADFRLLRDEFRASRAEAVAWNLKFQNLSERVDKDHDLIEGLKKTTGNHAERIDRLERTGTYDEE